MSSRISDYKSALYVRDYFNDLPPQTDLIKRVALAAIPFLSLHRSLRLPISLAMGTLRVWNTDQKDLFNVSLSVMALAATFFQMRLGIALTTLQDMTIDIQRVRHAQNYKEAAPHLIKLLGNLVYLTLLVKGGLEIALLAHLIQIVVQLIECREEFNKDHWIEAISHLLMAGVRLQQSYTHYQQLKRNWEIEAAMKRIFVGPLHEKWQFPSDHLPIGIEVNGVRIISWNVLNQAYMEWVTEKDSQGLNRSMISDLNQVVDANGLTQRDVVIADMIQNMMQQGQVVALQECSEPFLQHLQHRLPSHWEMIKSFQDAHTDQDVILYDKTQLSYLASLSETTRSAYPSCLGRPLQNAYFKQAQGQDLRIINAHIPGDPQKPGALEFARYVKEAHQEGAITIGLGDCNFERDEMLNAFKEAGFSEFSLHSPWKTNIHPNVYEAKGIDHVFVIGDENSRDLTASQILHGGHLEETIRLLT